MLRYSTSDRTVKLVDTSRWRSMPTWRKINSKDCDTALTDIAPKLGVPHPDRKVVRRTSIR